MKEYTWQGKVYHFSDEQLRQLSVITFDNLKRVFPNIPRRLLEVVRKDSREKFIEATVNRYAERSLISEARAEISRLAHANNTLRKELEAMARLSEFHPPSQVLSKPSKGGGVASIYQASDWHCEEVVLPEAVGGVNEYNLEIFDKRNHQYWRNVAKLYERDHPAITVVALQGDFISGRIHEDQAENTALAPVDAAIYAETAIAGGLSYFLDNSEGPIDIVCNVGNHSRTTKDVHTQQEQGYSLETFMYHALRLRFANNTRLRWHIPKAYDYTLSVYGKRCRFHHGHHINYGGGVGGIMIPINKALAQWNSWDVADLDFMGHWHQRFAGPNFRVNGSLIGANTYAKLVKARLETPQQQISYVHERQGIGGSLPIWVE